MMRVRCNNCYWQGYEEDLPVFLDEKNKEHFHGCPNCRTDEYIMNLEED